MIFPNHRLMWLNRDGQYARPGNHPHVRIMMTNRGLFQNE